MNLTLDTTGSAEATTGILHAGSLTLFTIELPWVDDTPDASCVPAGAYELVPYLSPKHGQTWRLHNPELGVWGFTDVPPFTGPWRTEIEIHVANFARELLGCIGVGLSGNPMFDSKVSATVPAVQQSGAAVLELRATLGTDAGHTLEITRQGVPPM